MDLRLRVNGEVRPVTADPLDSLLELLRDQLSLPGTKNACEEGECGSCTVWLDDEIVCACLVPAVQAADRDVVTVESLGADGLHPVQEELLRAGGVQCGFCTPGVVVAAADLLRRDPVPDDDAIREALAGNLCRCTGYTKILGAVRVAANRLSSAGVDG